MKDSRCNFFLGPGFKGCFYLLVFLCSFSFAQAQSLGNSACSNSDFELGNFTNWIGKRGTCCPINANTLGIVSGRHTIMTGTGLDPMSCGAIPVVAPGGTFSARLGNSTSGAQAEKLVYTLAIDTFNAILIFRYAVVMEDPNHTTAQQPRFAVSIRNPAGALLDSTCGFYQVTAAPGNPGFFNCSGRRYRPWTTAVMDLTSYIGTTIQIEFATGDCSLGGHFGYAYVDAQCTSSELQAYYCENDTTAVISAPPGFVSYLWDDGSTGPTRIVPFPQTGQIVWVTCTSITGCSVTLSASLYPSEPFSGFSGSGECFNNYQLLDTSTSTGYSTITSWLWNFGDGTGSTQQNPVHAFPSIGPYQVSLVVTNNVGCIDTLTQSVSFWNNPVLSVNSPGGVICPGDTLPLNATGMNTYSWTPFSSLTSPTGNNVGAFPMATTTYSISGVDSLGCELEDTLSVSVSVPTFLINTPAPVCPGDSVTLTVTGGTGFNWLPGNISGSTMDVNPLVTTQYSVTGMNLNNCEETDTVSVTVNPFPSVQASASPPVICIGFPSTLSATGNAATWSWAAPISSGSSSLVISPAASAIYNLTGTLNGCSFSDTVQVIVNPLPVVTMSPLNPQICPGFSETFSASGAMTYNWSPGASAGSTLVVQPTGTQSVSVTGTDINGCIDSATTSISLFPLSLNATAIPNTLCLGNQTTLSVSGGSSFTWSPGSLTGSSVNIVPAATTTYTVSGTNLSNCPEEDTISVTILPLPVVQGAANPTEICIGDIATLAASGTAANWSWSNGAGVGNSVSVSPITTTVYTLTGTLNICVGTDTAMVVVHPLPNVAILPPNPEICIGDVFNLVADGAVNYVWQPGNIAAGNLVVSPLLTSSYTLTGTDNFNCINTDQTTLVVHPLPVIIAAAADSGLCPGESTLLTASGALNYVWNPGGVAGTSALVSPSSGTTYQVVGTDINFCVGIDSVFVDVWVPPTVNAVAVPPEICFGDTTALFVTGALNYLWMPGSYTSDSVFLTPGSSTLFNVIGTDSNTCKDTAFVQVIVNQLPTIDLGNSPLVICEGYTGTLSASGAVTYSWEPGTFSGNPMIISPLVPTTYTVTGTDINNCINSTIHQVDIETMPVLNLGIDTAICFGDKLLLDAGYPGSDYQWSDGSNSKEIMAMHEGVYWVIVNDGVCIFSDSISLQILPLPQVQACHDQTTWEGVPVKLNAWGASTYLWTPNLFLDCDTCSQITSTTWQNVSYEVIGTDTLGCMNLDSVNVYVTWEETLFIPNAFTPGGGDKNEIFNAVGVHIKEMEMLIFDRFGNIIFETQEIGKGWNGHTRDGNIAQAGAYIYKIKGQWDTETRFERVGIVSVIR